MCKQLAKYVSKVTGQEVVAEVCNESKKVKIYIPIVGIDVVTFNENYECNEVQGCNCACNQDSQTVQTVTETFEPFQKVLVKNENGFWFAALYSHYDDSLIDKHVITDGSSYPHCVSYDNFPTFVGTNANI